MITSQMMEMLVDAVIPSGPKRLHVYGVDDGDILGIKNVQLEKIKIENLNNSTEQSFQMLRKWSATCAPEEFTFTTLREALLKAECLDVLEYQPQTELLETNAKSESIFNVVKSFIDKKDILLNNIVAFATDGAPSMTGSHHGFISDLKVSLPDIFTMQCVIHRRLFARNLSGRLHGFLSTVITATNKIKSHALNSRLFQQLCFENDEDFQKLLFHTEVRWLPRGNCLNCFYASIDSKSLRTSGLL
ncbi:SCAN domain-containing protein 3-like [Octopus sinensis]|uniref:SCAN domain-containing protein 3-like n=1 Tax=Octopus sinensis TaxID=2607531 RepID=A0A7E6FSW6_9MOLL|nr:SCAN domain-containing protein 3-like [Octopus sinensis]